MRRTLTFATLFIVLVGAMLIGYQYARPTELNHRYLFLVGKHTAATIDFLVESAEIEGASAYSARPEQARSELAAWREQGILRPEPPQEDADAANHANTPPNRATDAEPEEPPLTPYERYAYRTLGYARQVELERDYLAKLTAPLPDPVTAATAEEHLRLVRERYDRLKGSVERSLTGSAERKSPLPSRPRTWSLAPEPVVNALPAIEETLTTLETTPPDDKQAYVAALTGIEKRIAELEPQQVTFLQSRLRQARETYLTSGPYVNLQVFPAPNDRIAALTDELNELLNADGPMTAERARAIAWREAESNRQKRIRSRWAERTNPSAGSRTPWEFAFVVVPSCGAFEVMAIFIAAVAAFPCALWKRAAGLVLGIPVLYALNVGRLACLGIIGGLDRENRIFDFAHEVVWQGIFVIFVVVVYLLWVILLVRRREQAASD